ncbi:MAG: response regulator transcription factor [Acidobacteria bacterium]|nr:response regulator transcription factor [Acidobacteriota bacterium]
MTTDPIIRLLLVEDDRRLADLTREYLERHHVAVSLAFDGERGLDEALRFPFDVVLLDVMLPRRDGLGVCRAIREHKDVPIIMITARGEEADRVLGLETGADDYVPKPFSPRELLARVRSVVRRARGQAGPRRTVLTRGALTLDPAALSANRGGERLDLTAHEFHLLYALAENAGRVLTRERLLDLAGGGEEAFDRSVDVHVSRLRRKLGDDPHQPRLIRTVRGAGYLFLAEGEGE